MDIRSGDLSERHIGFGTFMGRLLILADHGHGHRPQPTDYNRQLAACAIASLAGMDGDQAVGALVDNREICELFFGEAA